jgi:hypothetical protein
MSPSFSHGEWSFEWSAAGVGPTVILLSCSPLADEEAALAKALEQDYFVICLQASGDAAKKFATAVEAFFTERQLHRAHWVVAEDARHLANALAHQPRMIWSMTDVSRLPDKSLTLRAEPVLRRIFTEVDKPYRTSEHPI